MRLSPVGDFATEATFETSNFAPELIAAVRSAADFVVVPEESPTGGGYLSYGLANDRRWVLRDTEADRVLYTLGWTWEVRDYVEAQGVTYQ